MTAASKKSDLVPGIQPARNDVAPDAGSRTRGMVAGVEGYDAQAAVLAPKAPGPAAAAPVQRDAADPAKAADPEKAADPAKADEAKAADPTKAPADKAGAPAGNEQSGPDALSPLRQAMLKQFQLLEGKGIGDAEFEAVCGKDWWEKRKKNEADAKAHNEKLPQLIAEWEAKCAADPEFAKSNPKPKREDDSVFTTCIATQGKLLEAAFKACGLHEKRGDAKFDNFTFATMGRIEATKRGAWQESSVGIGARPKLGDVLVLEMRGGADKVQKDIDGESSKYGMYGQSSAKLDKEIAQLQAASQSATEAIAHAAAAKLPEVQKKLEELKAKHDAKLVDLNAKLATARDETAQKAGSEKETKGGRMGGLDFSHVGCFQSMTPELDASGKATGREIWTTFDGGQNVPGKIDSQGAKSSTRIYDPKTNEIVAAGAKAADGTMTQDGKTRWLGGWADIDKLVAG